MSPRLRAPSTVALGAALFGEILARAPDLEALFACNDDLALGALFECHRRGIRVPGDLSIIGFNDLEVCASAYPALSSVATPRYEMGRRAAEIVLEIIRGSGMRPADNRIDLGFSISERASTTGARRRRPPPASAGRRLSLASGRRGGADPEARGRNDAARDFRTSVALRVARAGDAPAVELSPWCAATASGANCFSSARARARSISSPGPATSSAARPTRPTTGSPTSRRRPAARSTSRPPAPPTRWSR